MDPSSARCEVVSTSLPNSAAWGPIEGALPVRSRSVDSSATMAELAVEGAGIEVSEDRSARKDGFVVVSVCPDVPRKRGTYEPKRTTQHEC